MAEEKATILRVPDLPNVVKGDGRYLMTLLRDFLAQTAHEVNLANGFSAEDIQKRLMKERYQHQGIFSCRLTAWAGYLHGRMFMT